MHHPPKKRAGLRLPTPYPTGSTPELRRQMDQEVATAMHDFQKQSGLELAWFFHDNKICHSHIILPPEDHAPSS